MLPNEVFALACRAYYDEQGLIVDEGNGEFAHCPLPKGMGDKGYYLLHEHHQQQGLLQSRDVGRCCFFVGDAKRWLQNLDYFPDNFFELWDIFERYANEQGRQNSFRLQTAEVYAKRNATLKEKFKDEMPKNLPMLHTPEIQAKATAGKVLYWGSPEGDERKSKMKQRKVHNQRRVEITFQSGKVGIYATCRLAATALGVSAASITLWAQGRVKPSLPISARYV